MSKLIPALFRKMYPLAACAGLLLGAANLPVQGTVPGPVATPRVLPRLSALAAEPSWKKLDAYQGTMTREEFTRLLDGVYAPGEAWKNVITFTPDGAEVLTSGTDRWLLRFAPDAGTAKAPPRYWKPIEALPPADTPLDGLTIALDPGHLGGEWAKMEERWFQTKPGTLPVTEGDMTLLTSQILAAELESEGAKVEFVRDTAQPLTKLRPADLRDTARRQLQQQGVRFIRENYGGAADELRMNSVQWTSELLFYRTAEIQARAERVNNVLKPDLVLCLHYNAERWGDEQHPTLVPKNHMHVLVNGSYDAAELMLDDVRFDMLVKLLSRCYAVELPVAEHIAKSLSAATGLPPYKYTTPNAARVGDNPYIWARNLLANRLYQCPVVYIEPYVMNSQEVWDRVQAGDYDGRKPIDGKVRESIYREYAKAVAAGVAAAARDMRK